MGQYGTEISPEIHSDTLDGLLDEVDLLIPTVLRGTRFGGGR